MASSTEVSRQPSLVLVPVLASAASTEAAVAALAALVWSPPANCGLLALVLGWSKGWRLQRRLRCMCGGGPGPALAPAAGLLVLALVLAAQQ